MATAVSRIQAASPAEAEAHFAAEFTFETDCWDVREAMLDGPDFVLLDVRSPALFARGHVSGAINLPHRQITVSKMAEWPDLDLRSMDTRPESVSSFNALRGTGFRRVSRP